MEIISIFDIVVVVVVCRLIGADIQYTSIPGLCGGCDQQVPSYTGRYLPQPGTHTIYCTWRQADEEEKIGNYFFIGRILSCIIY